MRGGERGFSLVELLAALAIVAVLAAVALPAYRRHAYRARRVEGKELLLRIAHAQERHYATYNRYGDLADLGFVEPAWLEQRFYRATLRLGAGDSPQSFVAVAWPSAAQTGDACGVLSVDDTGRKEAAGSGDAAGGGACW